MMYNSKRYIESMNRNYMDNTRIKTVEESFEAEQREWAKSFMKND